MKKKIINELRTQEDYLKSVINNVQQRLNIAPEGSLNIIYKKGRPRFYRYSDKLDKKGNRVYLNKGQQNLIAALAQKDYDKDVLKTAIKQKKVIGEFLEKYEPSVIRNIYDSLSPERKKLILAEELDNAEYAKRWEAVTYQPGNFAGITSEFITLKGERVRSKSEKIIADRLYIRGIPYRYEYPLKLKNGRVIRPDFIILNIETREEYILEHFGRMDDPEYVNGNYIPKMRSYAQNGIFPGDKLLFTTESSINPFSVNDLDLLLDHFFGQQELPA